MGIQFGMWKFDGGPTDLEVLKSTDEMLCQFGPDGSRHYQGGGVTLSYHALHTTTESRRQQQPYMSASGLVAMWDGRLDNREELIAQLGNELDSRSAEVVVVAACFERWGTNCFAKLLGDWALTLWNSRDQQLILAKDLMGIRPLYYFLDGSELCWSSVLDPLLTVKRRAFRLDMTYVAGWFFLYPAAEATPYVGVRAVPPCSFVAIKPGGFSIQKYWDFDSSKRIRYKSDSEYEEHFRAVFTKSVQRRLRSDGTICAELSGGMDSPSIVCTADLLAAASPDGFPEIETLSYYDEAEPNANELPYITEVEKKRGHAGYHINITGSRVICLPDDGPFEAIPGGRLHAPGEELSPYARFLHSKGIRVVLSGLGGDEMMGGVPTPYSELQDLITQGQIREIAHQLKGWALHQRRPWMFLLAEALSGFVPPSLLPYPKYLRPVPWFNDEFVRNNQTLLVGFCRRVALFGALPSFQANIAAIDTLRSQLATKATPSMPSHEKRYPFLDRDLLEFVLAIPRQQMLRPGQRRSLMRRALAGIVPDAVLGRRRKAYVSRSPRLAISREWEMLEALTRNMASDNLGIVDQTRFREALVTVQNSDGVPLSRLMRTLEIECWLRNVLRNGVISNFTYSQP